MLKVKMVLLVLFLMMPANHFAQQKVSSMSDLGYWTRVKLFDSNVDTIKNLFGEGTILDRSYMGIFGTEYGTLTIKFSYSQQHPEYTPCWKVADWTAIEVSHSVSEINILASDLIQEGMGFKETAFGDFSNHRALVNIETGITIVYEKTTGKIINIIVRPSRKDVSEFLCEKQCGSDSGIVLAQ